jgi:hypothetical protein
MKKSKKTNGPQTEVDPSFAPIVAAFAKNRNVTAGKLMSSYGLKVNGKIFAIGGVGERFDPGHGRVMKEWIAIEARTESWLELAKEAYNFVKVGKV